MLYKIAHLLRDNLPWLWNMAEVLNSFFFSIRYGKKMNKLYSVPIVLDSEILKDYLIIPIRNISATKILAFFEAQPEEAFTFFHPHNFDLNTIKRLQHSNSFVAFVLVDRYNDQIAGYCFNRSFCNGKGFRGRMVDINYRGKGLGTIMNKILNEVGFGLGLRLFETVNKKNVASYKSAISASKVNVIKEMEDGDLLLEILKD